MRIAERRDKLVPYAQMLIIISHNQLPWFRSLFGLQFSKKNKPENKPHEQLSYGVLILFALRLRRLYKWCALRAFLSLFRFYLVISHLSAFLTWKGELSFGWDVKMLYNVWPIRGKLLNIEFPSNEHNLINRNVNMQILLVCLCQPVYHSRSVAGWTVS